MVEYALHHTPALITEHRLASTAAMATILLGSASIAWIGPKTNLVVAMLLNTLKTTEEVLVRTTHQFLPLAPMPPLPSLHQFRKNPRLRPSSTLFRKNPHSRLSSTLLTSRTPTPPTSHPPRTPTPPTSHSPRTPYLISHLPRTPTPPTSHPPRTPTTTAMATPQTPLRKSRSSSMPPTLIATT